MLIFSKEFYLGTMNITWEKIKGVSDDLYQRMFPKKETLLQKEEEDITQQWSQI